MSTTSRLPVMLLLASGCLITETDHESWIDQDQDDVLRDVDCDDEDPSVGAPATWYSDGDGDGYAADGASTVEACSRPDGATDLLGDCDDEDADAWPGAPDEWYDGVDSDCAEDDDFDQDLDGWAAEEWGPDCDDEDAEINPEAFEYNDDIDNNCDGDIDYLSLANADAVLSGQTDMDRTSRDLAGAGDVNGDGYDDLIIGSDHPGSEITVRGKAWYVPGPITGERELEDVGYLLTSTDLSNKTGYAVDGAGDVDADGYDDLLIGAHKMDASGDTTGGAYLLFGPVSADTLLGTSATVFTGENANDNAGYAVRGAGDVDGDEFADFMVTAVYYPADTGDDETGATYLISGAESYDAISDLGAVGLRIEGQEDGDRFGRDLQFGDLTGDGFDEILIGAKEFDDPTYSANTGVGAAYIFDFEGTPAPISADDATWRVQGEADDDLAGGALAVGDLDSDGYLDLLVGAESASFKSRDDAGAVYIFEGGSGKSASSLSDADARLQGQNGENAGRNMAVLGDFNDDGAVELAVGAPKAGTMETNAGAVYVLSGPFEGVVELEDAGWVLVGEDAGHYAGWSLDLAGDVDADGLPDLLVGAFDNNGVAAGPGKAYLLSGREY